MLRRNMKNRVPEHRLPVRAARRGRSRKLLLEILEDRTVLSPLAAGPVGIHATEGLLYDGAVTTFTDANHADT
jgi:hypothetical protein